MDGSGVARGAPSHSPTSPNSSRQGNGIPKRKRSVGIPAHLESSPGSDHDDDQGDDKKRQPGVKRACNECRQQKVSQCQRLPRLSKQPRQHFFVSPRIQPSIAMPNAYSIRLGHLL